jgi:L-seryl-tRNA(Ser) seleniumtransferase
MNVYEKLGVKTVINAVGSLTNLGGSRMASEVAQAYMSASKHFVNLWELHQAAGRIIAEFMGVDMGMVTSGCAAAMSTAAAACIVKHSGITDPIKLRKILPRCEDISNEILFPKSHRNIYAQAFEVGGGKLVEFGDENGFTDNEFEESITDDTVALGFILRYGQEHGRSNIKALDEACKLAHKHNIPVIVDAAAEIPPRENLKKIVETGVDLICFSGGKDIMGPNDTGLLFGRRDLMIIAHFLSAPHQQVVRPMKVGRESIVAQITALQRYLLSDEKSRYQKWEDRVKYWIDELSNIPHINVEKYLPEKGEWRSQSWPRAKVTIDEEALKTRTAQIIWELMEGEPAVYVAYPRIFIKDNQLFLGITEAWAERNYFMINPNHLTDEEVKIIAKRLKKVLLDPPKRIEILPSRQLT